MIMCSVISFCYFTLRKVLIRIWRKKFESGFDPRGPDPDSQTCPQFVSSIKLKQSQCSSGWTTDLYVIKFSFGINWFYKAKMQFGTLSKGNRFSELKHEIKRGKWYSTQNISCSISCSSTFCVISRKFWLLFGQCRSFTL